MSLITSEGFMTCADRTDLTAAFPLHATTNTNTTFTTISGRRVCDLYGANLARRFTPRRRVCANFIVDLTSGVIGGSTTLFAFGLNPANVAAAAYASTNNDRFLVRAVGSQILVTRQAFDTDGALVSGSQTIATATSPMTAGNSYRVEIMVDVSSATGVVQVLVNGIMIVNAEFSRAIGTHACNADYGILSLYCQSTSGCRGRFSNVVLYADEGKTRWPKGQMVFSYGYATANAGETISVPPLATDPDIIIDSTTGKTWSLSDISGVTAAQILGVVGSVRLGAPNALSKADADITFKDGATVLASASYVIQPGMPAEDKQIIIPTDDPAVLNAMVLNVRQTP